MAGVPERKKPDMQRNPAGEPAMALDFIKRAIKSRLLPINEDGELRQFRAEIAFQGDLREYVRLQGQASGEKKRLSNIISFTSAGSNVDALALPTSKYVSDTWKQEGVNLLRMIEKALDDTKNQGVSGFLSQKSHVSVTVHDKYLFLKIKGEKDSFPTIIEQVCWVVSVAGRTSISLLEKYARETNGGKKTRGYAETLHAGKPIITAGPDGRFEVSFRPRPPEIHDNHGAVARTGNCWKTMAGLSIVADGYRIPKRPTQGSGLEAPLSVLRQLFRRGCPGKRVVPLDKPMVMIPTEVGKDNEACQLRLLMAVGAQKCTQGNAVYWHFHPATLCNSLASCEQLEKEIGVSPSMLDPQSRHFVGWSSKAGFLAGTSKTNDIVFKSKLTVLEHYKLAITSASLNFRLPLVFSLGVTVATERVDNPTSAETMYSDAGSALHALKYRFFVLWDTKDERGWLVNGPVAALQVLRSYLKDREAIFDFSKLNHINDETPSAAYDLLRDEENMKMVVFPKSKDVTEKPEAGESSEDAKETTFEHVSFNVYKVLLQLSKITIETSGKSGNNIPDWFHTWVGKRWDSTVRGWDFTRIYHSYEPQVFLKKFHTDPGWLDLTRGLQACFLFGRSFGEIMQPRDGQCCPYFKTLPKGENYLAVGMSTIQTCANDEGAAAEATDTVAKLAPRVAWERDVNPFNHTHGQGDHLDKVDPSCFPVQRLVKIRDNGNDEKKDKDVLRKSKGRLYSWKEVDEMNTPAEDKNKKTIEKSLKTGVVVFGRKPDATKLRQLAQANAPATVGSLSKTPTQQAQAAETQRPSSSHSLKSNTSARDPRSTGPPTKGQPSGTPAGRAPSVTSIKSTHPSTQRKAPDASPGVERPQAATTPQAPPASAQRTPSVSSVTSTASKTHPKAPFTVTNAGQAQTGQETQQLQREDDKFGRLQGYRGLKPPGTSRAASHPVFEEDQYRFF
ncbi:hypothetical protein INS49_014089 [Diaporthe citri]|uniref:uncharacterized protein n=1 Tax=Diaporthe citri TaxID=83186 RepID=UPI001C8143C9|nr:uncharacterized protein INS49_014089 [Diaporthe citri]KAG6358205.1 hypothetical protein INS49_014089 [Diaporthe citri]